MVYWIILLQCVCFSLISQILWTLTHCTNLWSQAFDIRHWHLSDPNHRHRRCPKLHYNTPPHGQHNALNFQPSVFWSSGELIILIKQTVKVGRQEVPARTWLRVRNVRRGLFRIVFLLKNLDLNYFSDSIFVGGRGRISDTFPLVCFHYRAASNDCAFVSL